MCTIGFTGDLNLTGAFAREVGEETFAEPIRTFFADNDATVCNIEGPVTSRPSVKDEGVSLASAPEHVDGLAKLGRLVFFLANNHIMDSGVEGLDDTLAVARRLGAGYFGAGGDLKEALRPHIVEQDGLRVALIGVCHPEGELAGNARPGVCCQTRAEEIRAAIHEAKDASDWVVVVYHGGEEYTFVPMPSRRRLLRGYLEMGADLVVGHHAHTVQGYEWYQGKAICYSLGNFVFDQPALYGREGVTDSILLRVTFTRQEYRLEPLATRINHAARRVESLAAHEHFVEIDEARYHYHWCRDAARVLQSVVSGYRQAAPARAGTVRASPLPLWLRGKSYRTLWKLLRRANYRPLLLGALEYRVKRALKIW